jgi:hypothetical protein
MNDTRFKQISSDVVNRYTSMIDSNPWVSIAFDLHMSSLLSGGIYFSQNGIDIKDSLKTRHSEVWCAFFRDVFRQVWATGFAVVGYIDDPDEDFGKLPAVIKLSKVDIFMYQPLLGDPVFRVFEKQTGDTLSSMFPSMWNTKGKDESLQDIKVLSGGRWPTKDGVIRSIVSRVLEEISLSNALTSTLEYESRWLRQPIFTTETKKEIANASNASRQLEEMAKELVALDAKAHMSTMEMNVIHDGQSVSNIQSDSVVIMDEVEAGIIAPPCDTKMTQIRASAHIGELVGIRDASRDRVFQILGIPTSMFGGRSSGSSRSSADAENQRYVFTSIQRTFKPNIIQWGKRIFRWMSEGKIDNIEITVPSVPPQSVINELYELGIYKHNKYVDYISETHSIPITSLHRDRPRVPIQFQPAKRPPTSTPKGAPSKKKQK